MLGYERSVHSPLSRDPVDYIGVLSGRYTDVVNKTANGLLKVLNPSRTKWSPALQQCRAVGTHEGIGGQERLQFTGVPPQVNTTLFSERAASSRALESTAILY